MQTIKTKPNPHTVRGPTGAPWLVPPQDGTQVPCLQFSSVMFGCHRNRLGRRYMLPFLSCSICFLVGTRQFLCLSLKVMRHCVGVLRSSAEAGRGSGLCHSQWSGCTGVYSGAAEDHPVTKHHWTSMLFKSFFPLFMIFLFSCLVSLPFSRPPSISSYLPTSLPLPVLFLHLPLTVPSIFCYIVASHLLA